MIEPIVYSKGFPEALQLFITLNDIKPTFLYEFCNPPNSAGLTSEGWTGFSYYQNFFISRIQPWMEPQVTQLLDFLDRIGGMYLNRWSDALVHAAVAQIFMPKERVLHFSDFEYKHSNELAHKGVAMHWGEGNKTRFWGYVKPT